MTCARRFSIILYKIQHLIIYNPFDQCAALSALIPAAVCATLSLGVKIRHLLEFGHHYRHLTGDLYC